MSSNMNWDINKYKENHESNDHWELRKAFMEKWKEHYPEERLVCLARVFANMEFLGCRYPQEVMQEVSKLSQEVAKTYRHEKKSKLQRTFVAASTMAEDRVKGIKRTGGIVENSTPAKASRINFVPQGSRMTSDNNNSIENTEENLEPIAQSEWTAAKSQKEKSLLDAKGYINNIMNMERLDLKYFHEDMFNTSYGRLVLLIRPWAGKIWNMQASCQACKLPFEFKYKNGICVYSIRGKILAEGQGETKAEAKSAAEALAWTRLSEQSVILIVKEQWIAQGDARISLSDFSGPASKEASFGTPIESSVALKMMQMMGWKGGGLGAESQGIEEPIKPKMQMVNRAGLGSDVGGAKQFRRAAQGLMRRFLDSGSFDLDLVFSSDFTKEERAALHQCAKSAGLASKSYGDVDRFLVVKKKMEPFSLFRAVLENGGNTSKYQIIIPATLRSNGR